MGIKEYLFGSSVFQNPAHIGTYYQKENGSSQHEIDGIEVKKEPEITFESDKELLERSRYVKVGDECIGYLHKRDGVYVFWQDNKFNFSKVITMQAMIAITEKLKELNGCSDVQVEIKKLEQRLTQLEMMNSSSLTRNQVDEIVAEINGIRKRLMELM